MPGNRESDCNHWGFLPAVSLTLPLTPAVAETGWLIHAGAIRLIVALAAAGHFSQDGREARLRNPDPSRPSLNPRMQRMRRSYSSL